MLREYIRLLLELRDIDIRKRQEGDEYSILVYKGWLFKMPYAYDAEDIPWGELRKAVVRRQKRGQNTVGIEDIKQALDDEVISTDFLFGSVNPNGELYIANPGTMKHSPISSRLVRQVVSHLGLRRVTTGAPPDYEDDYYDENPRQYSSSQAVGKLPSVLWHGTSSNSLFGRRGILKMGLTPGGSIGKSNWSDTGIWHDRVVSLTVRPEDTYFHARRAAQQFGGFPIIVGFKVPDQSKIIADYDVDTETGATTGTFTNIRARAKERPSPYKRPQRVGRGPLKTSIDVGVVGYEGRIPASFIESFMYWSPSGQEWVSTNLNDLKSMQDNFLDWEGYGEPSNFESPVPTYDDDE